MSVEYIEGGVCAAQGFSAAGIHCGVRPNKNKNDLAVIFSSAPCSAAGLFTLNKVKAAPVWLDIETVKGGKARAIAANSGNANACAPEGMENALRMRAAAAKALGIAEGEMLVSSTGVIGQRLNIEAIEAGLPTAVGKLAHSGAGSEAAATAIMTTDTKKKEFACKFTVGGRTAVLGGIAKGSGMIHPNMGTMLCYLTTDCAVAPDMLRSALKAACGVTFNRISVDGDTSTNDSLIILANGLAGNAEITEKDADYEAFLSALTDISTTLARAMAADGEGAKHLITCAVSGAADDSAAETLSKSVIGSTLTKAAIFGCDANWGRVLCAMGYSGVEFDPEAVDITFKSAAGTVPVCKSGRGLAFDEELAKKVLTEPEVVIEVKAGDGAGSAVCWGCDLTYDYVRINGDYRT
jgi:glutamate N-acetyltransferase/amino-acid N-acetyltransferase